jgi:hypothetical protein
MALVGIGVGLVYAMLAKLILDSVRPEVTGVALGMNITFLLAGGAAFVAALGVLRIPPAARRSGASAGPPAARRGGRDPAVTLPSPAPSARPSRR